MQDVGVGGEMDLERSDDLASGKPEANEVGETKLQAAE